MASSGQDEGHAAFGQAVANRPDMLAPKVNIEKGDVEAALGDCGHSLLHAFHRADHLVAERVEEVLEHHRDERFVLDDQDGAGSHAATVTMPL